MAISNPIGTFLQRLRSKQQAPPVPQGSYPTSGSSGAATPGGVVSSGASSSGAVAPDPANASSGTPDALAAKLLTIYGPTYPAPAAAPAEKWNYLQQLIRDGDPDALLRYRIATRNLLYYNNRQWIDWVAGRRAYEDLPNAENELRVTNNYIAPILRARTARLLPAQVGWYGIPDSNAYEAKDKTEVAVNLVKHRYRTLDMDHKLRSALPFADCAGVVAIKSFWNADIGPLTPATFVLPQLAMTPDGQPDIDPTTGAPNVQWVPTYIDQQGNPVPTEEAAYQYRPGDTDTCTRTIFNIRMNPDAQGWTMSEGLRWLIDTDIVPLATARAKFPDLAALIQPLSDNENYLMFERMIQASATPRMAGFITAPAGMQRGMQPKDLTAVREYWELPNTCFRHGRVIVGVGGQIAYDGPFPQGIFPYAPIFSGVAALSPWGRALVNDLISPQDVINREWSAIVAEMANTSGGQYVAWDMPGVADSITNAQRSIIKLPYNSYVAQRAIGDVFKRLEPAQVPADRWHMIEAAKATMFDVGAFHEISRGQIPPGLDSGVAIQQLTEAEAGQLKEPIEAIRRCLRLWAYHQLALAKWGYHGEEQRALPVDRPDLGFMVEGVSGADLPDPDAITIDIDQFKPQSEAALMADIKELMVQKIIDPRDGLRAMDIGRGIEGLYDSATRDYARARGENLAFQQQAFQMIQQAPVPQPDGSVQAVPPAILHPDGSPFLLPQDDAHDVHIRVHYELLKDDTLPWPLRQVILTHVQEHRMAGQGQMLQAAAQQGAMATQAQPPQQGGPPGGGGAPPPGGGQ